MNCRVWVMTGDVTQWIVVRWQFSNEWAVIMQRIVEMADITENVAMADVKNLKVIVNMEREILLIPNP